MAYRPAPEFLHRPQGVEASPIGGGRVARPYRPVRAVLQTRHGGILVRGIVPQPDGTFTGEAYGVMPHEPSVGRGDKVRFEESQIFSFKIDEPPADEGLARMQSAFEAGWRELEGAEAPESPARESALPVVSTWQAPAQAHPPERAAAHTVNDPPPREDATMQNPDSPNDEPLTCIECGAKLPAAPDPHEAHDAPPGAHAEAPPPKRVTCRVCGRINDLEEARAAALRHRRG